MRTAPELLMLALAVIVGLVQLVWAATAARLHQKDMAWAAGPRDTPMELSGVAGRLDRAFKNFMETFPFFAAALIAAYLAGKLGTLTLWGSAIYVVSRALYVPAYAAGIPTLRTLIWFPGVVGIVMIVAAIFLA